MNERDVTGRWEGIFNYPGDLPPNGFVATLVERAGVIAGKTDEVSDREIDLGATLAATIAGERVGSAVRFTKRYDAGVHPVQYAGTLSPEGDEIVGEWTIPGVWSGSFIMVRQPGQMVKAEEGIGAEVR
jgi:hypothetical protein